MEEHKENIHDKVCNVKLPSNPDEEEDNKVSLSARLSTVTLTEKVCNMG